MRSRNVTKALAQAPDFYLTSTEQRGEFAKVRSCKVKFQVKGPDHREYMVVSIDPPVVGQAFGRGGDDIRVLMLTPRHVGFSLVRRRRYPIAVQVYLIESGAVLESRVFGVTEAVLIAWGEVYDTAEAAATALSGASAQ